MERCSPDVGSVNVWANELRQRVEKKRKTKAVTSKSDRIKEIKQNNDILSGLLKVVIQKANQEKQKKADKTKVEIFSHKIFEAISEILKLLDKLSFHEAKDIIGKSLRDDYSIL